MFRRVLRHDFVSSLAALVVTLLSLPAAGAQRDHLLRWIIPPDNDVAGYKVFVALSSMNYGQGEDIGPRLPDSQGIASYLYEGLDSDTDYFVVMTTLDTEGLESVFSNEIVLQALACDPTPCDDGNLCTIDACSGSLCTNGPVPEGTTCDDGDPGTVQDACFGGICSGVAIQCGSDLAVDPKGKGTGVANHPLFEAPIAFMVKGRQKGRNENVKIALKFKFVARNAGILVKDSASESFALDTLREVYTCSASLKVTAGEEKLTESETSGGFHSRSSSARAS
jgi:hypothetical protein